jgi:hypothetical protein
MRGQLQITLKKPGRLKRTEIQVSLDSKAFPIKVGRWKCYVNRVYWYAKAYTCTLAVYIGYVCASICTRVYIFTYSRFHWHTTTLCIIMYEKNCLQNTLCCVSSSEKNPLTWHKHRVAAASSLALIWRLNEHELNDMTFAMQPIYFSMQLLAACIYNTLGCTD